MAKLFCSNKNKPIHCVVKKKKGVAGIGDNAGINITAFLLFHEEIVTVI